jgi:hypothetical protein
MSSTESSGAPAEASATTPASSAAPSFGSTRGSGLARGKRPTNSPASTATAASAEYTPTAIEVVTAPREYQNPFAPAEVPAAAAAPAARVVENPIPVIPVAQTDPVTTTLEEPAPMAHEAPLRIEPDAGSETDEPAELNILEPEQQKTAPAQTWESEGFRPAREPRNDRPRREESRRDEPRREEHPERAPRSESAPFDPASIPEKFLYVRPGYNYVPTPSNYGGAPRERNSRPADVYSPAASTAGTPAKSGGFLGWLKSLFGGSPAAPAPVETRSGEYRNGGDRHRGGRGHGQGGGGEGQRRRSRGGRGRSGGGYRGERSGGAQGGDSTG